MSDDDQQVASTEGVRRRAVLRAGAWAVPAVTVVAAAPAQATSLPPGALPEMSMWWEGATLRIALQIGATLPAGMRLVVIDDQGRARRGVGAAQPPTGWVEHLNVGPGQFAFASVAPTSSRVDFFLPMAGTTAFSWLSASLLDTWNYSIASSGVRGVTTWG